MNSLTLTWFRLLKTLLLLAFSYTFCRLLMLISYPAQFDWQTPAELLLLFIKGCRFDLAAILTTNLLWLILFLLPVSRSQNHIYSRLLYWIFLGINGFFLLLNFADIAYFPFIQTRMQFDAMRFVSGQKGSEFFHLLPRFIMQYWYLWLGWIMLLVLMSRSYNRIHGNDALQFPHWRSKLLSLLLFFPAFGIFLLGIRGGFQGRPLSIIHASEMSSAANIPLILNSTFTVLTTWDKTTLPEWNFIEETKLNKCDLNKYEPLQQKTFKKKNVVIIIVESMSRNHLGQISGKGNTPFLDSLLSHSLYFDCAFANARVSIEGIPAILASIPSWQDNPFIFSPYATNKIHSLATLLKTKGYHSSFFHGGNAGTMGFNYFCALAGFEKYYGREEFPEKNEFDGEWGIWDEPFLQFMVKELNQSQQPFASAVFTMNPHDPFRIPKKYRERFKQPGHPIESCIRYTDYALEEFFRAAQKSNWYKNTLFVITADHTAPVTEDKRYPSADEYRIPIAFFLPDSSLRGRSDQLAEQIDILPSTLDLLAYPDTFFSFGKSLFRNNCERSSVNYRNGLYQYFDSAYCYQFNGNSSVALYQWKTDSFFSNNLIWNGQNESLRMEKDRSLKIRIQQFNRALIRNRMQ